MNIGAAKSREPLLKSLQVYRGLAALLVVLYHLCVYFGTYFSEAWYANLWWFGSNGVKFFFVLSGFIIYHAHARELGRREVLGAYALKRITRIYPPYWIVTLALTPFWIFVTDLKGAPKGSLLASLLLLPQSVPPHLEVGWTLVHEVLFYALFALLFFDARWIYAGFLWAAAIVAYAAAGYSTHYLVDFFFSFYNLLFLLGVLIGFLHKRFARPDWLAGVSIVSGAALFIFGAMQVNGNHAGLLSGPRFPSSADQSILLFGLASGLLVFGCGNPRLEEKFFSSRFLLFLGGASYSIYLVHGHVLALTIKAVRVFHLASVVPAFLLWLILGIIATSLGCAFHVWVEVPVLAAIKNRLRLRRAGGGTVPGLGSGPVNLASATDEA